MSSRHNATSPPPPAAADQTPPATRRGAPGTGRYRYSARFIQLATRWIGWSIPVLLVIGVGLGIASDAAWAPDWLSTLGLGTVIFAGVGPLTVAAWLGGQSLHRFGGPVGLLLLVGLAGLVAGTYLGLTLFLVAGAGVAIVAGVLFYVLGFKANVPMWLLLGRSNGEDGTARHYVNGPVAEKPFND